MYLPEKHSYQYRAWAPWPRVDDQQQDWVTSMSMVETWLNYHCSAWAWDRVDLCYQAQYIGVAFEQDRDRLLFLLRWATVK